jgi:hypothetical protein
VPGDPCRVYGADVIFAQAVPPLSLSQEHHMSAVVVDGDAVRIVLTRAEKIAGLTRDHVVPLADVVAVAVVHEPVGATTGLRAPGLGIPGRRKVGTWRGRGRREFVCVRRGEPAVELTVTGQRFDSYLVGTPDADAVATAISTHLLNR